MIEFFRDVNIDGGVGSGAELPHSGYIFRRVAEEGQVPPDADEVAEALDEIGRMQKKLGMSTEDIADLRRTLELGRGPFPDGSLPVRFLQEGRGFFGGNRIHQVQAGDHILGLRDTLRKATEEKPPAGNIE